MHGEVVRIQEGRVVQRDERNAESARGRDGAERARRDGSVQGRYPVREGCQEFRITRGEHEPRGVLPQRGAQVEGGASRGRTHAHARASRGRGRALCEGEKLAEPGETRPVPHEGENASRFRRRRAGRVPRAGCAP